MKRPVSNWFAPVVAATLWAAAVRLYQIWLLPPPGWVDEIWYNLRARDLLQTGEFYIYYPTFWGGMHPLMVWLSAGIQAVGLHTPVASRMVTALAGTLTIPLAYACFKEFFPTRRAAAFTAITLAGLFYLVLVSRIGYGPALLQPLTLLCLWQMRRAERTGQWRSWVVAGVALGAAQYLNLNGRFLALLIAVLALHALWCSANEQRRSLFMGLALCAGVAVVIAAPLIAFFIREPQWFLARGRAVTVADQTPLSFLLNNLKLIALSFNVTGDLNPRHNLPGRPMLDIFQSVGFVFGLIGVSLQARQSRLRRDLSLWLALSCLSSLITSDAPQFERMSGVALPVAALVALGWEEIRARAPQVNWSPLMHTCLVLSLGLSAFDLFGRYPATPGLAAAMTHTPIRVAQQLLARANAGEAVFVEYIPKRDDVLAFEYLFAGTRVRRLDFRQCLPLTTQRPTRTTYLVLAEHDGASTTSLQNAYPTVTPLWLEPEEAALMGRSAWLEIPANTSAQIAAQPARATFAPGLTLVGYTISNDTLTAGQSLFLTLYWQVETALDRDVTSFIHIGTGLSDSANIAQRDGQPCQGLYPTSQWQVGDVIPDSFALIIPPDAPSGKYPVAVGWYQYPSLERLPLLSAETALPDNRAIVTTLTVKQP